MNPQERNTWVRRMGARSEWWGLRREPVVEPEWEIVDAHCHFWTERDFPDPQDNTLKLQTSRYLPEEYLRDSRDGHRITACVYVECGSGYRADGPQEMRPVGETAFASALADEMAAANVPTEIGAIVAHADMRSPNLGAVLDAHEKAGGGRVRGLRHSAARLEDPSARLIAGAAPARLCLDPDFRRGVALVGEWGLTFDAFLFQSQLGELIALAEAVPQTTIVANHLGGPIGFDPKAARDPNFPAWADRIEKLAERPNVAMKLGGLASIVTEYDGFKRDVPPSSEEFVAERCAYFHHAIRCFGAERCMFESNFPVDSISIGYGVLWNAFKKMAMNYDAAARRALLAETARRVYRMPPAPVRAA